MLKNNSKMLVELLEDVFKSDKFEDLRKLIDICLYRNRYFLKVPLNKVQKLKNFEKLRDIDKEAIEELFNQLIQGVERKSDVLISETNVSLFNIEEGIRYLDPPASIVLENNLNDGYFIETIVRNFGNKTEIQKNIENGWLIFENAGGCGNVGNFLEGKMRHFRHLPKENSVYLRCLVILDSDKKYPHQPLKQEYVLLLANYHKPPRIFIHILIKRSMENYLPIEAYNYVKAGLKRNFIDALSSLTPDQIDCYNIHLGFEGKALQELPQEIQTLYNDVSEVNFNILSKGAEMRSFKTEFPKLMESNAGVHKKSLLHRTKDQSSPTELNDIIIRIEQLL